MADPSAYASIEAGGADTGAPLNIRKRIARIQSRIDLHQKRVIDCGCGSGQYVTALHALGADAWGIEYSREKVAQFNRQSLILDRVSVADVQDIPAREQSFDIALLNEVLEHVSDETQTLREIHRILRAEGLLIVFSPNRFYPFETHGVYIGRSEHRVPHYFPFIPYLPVGLGKKFFRYWARNYWPWELRNLVTQCGFTIMHTGYIWQTFENISGKQPFFLSRFRRGLRMISTLLEHTTIIRTLGVSQVIIAQKNLESA